MSAEYNETQVIVTEHYRENTDLPANQRTVENIDFNPPKKKAWVRLIVIESNSSKITTCEVEEQGFIVLQVFSPLNKGTKGIHDIKSEFVNMLSNKNIQGVRCFDPSHTIVGKFDNYYQHNISINYKRRRQSNV